ncbi:endonuclease NucS domain-containing protein [Paenibacillus illinoisensis]|uniref:endonuclease NucS domain-containing protein n=1 Tax=Paenibacillus illinoisensis TaxID=59845 RepID=UPI0020411D01|nr:endonuclease NucS domain-containing protein [Paenibacillus illinoisensis]MCM3204001.1 endonuclease NucS [Paenibacillus illinoisensis]
MNYLIGYKDADRNNGHEDPMLNEFTYGESSSNTTNLLNVGTGDYLFFHKTIHEKRYITAYYYVEEVMLVNFAQRNPLIVNKFNNPHLKKSPSLLTKNECIAFGNPIFSKKLDVPLEITPQLLSKLSKPANLNSNQLPLAAISSALRTWKLLNNNDIAFLLDEINKNEDKGRLTNNILASDEVFQVLERDIEKLIASQPNILDDNYLLEGSQIVFSDDSRLDLLLKDTTNNEYIVVEIKKGAIDRNALNQIKHYIKQCQKELGLSNVKGILIGSSISKYYETEIINAKKDGITTRTYGWRFAMN